MKFEIDWKGQKYLMEWSDDVDFENLENVIQSYGFVFDEEGKLCIVDCDKGYWTLPGGSTEDYDNSFEDTLIREVDEEADLDIKNIKRVGCFKVTPLSENCERKEIHHILRYVAEVDKVKEQTIDPAVNAIPLRKFIKPEEFLDFVKWGESGAIQLEKALAVREKGKKRVGQVEVIVYRKAEGGHEFLMMKRVSEKGGFWQPVTGGIHVGEDIVDAAHREVMEETGFSDVKLTEQVYEFVLEKDNLPEYVFGAEVCCDDEVCIDNNVYPEHTEVKWCSFDEAMELLYWETNKEGLRKLVEVLGD